MRVIPLKPVVGETVDAYRTCEFVTLARDGTPIAWPTATLRRDDGTFLVSTSLAFAQKALNVRRDGRVALLFSDPTGSGLDAAQEVFVSGTAVCPEQIVTSPSGDEAYWAYWAYWAMIFDRQPDSRRYVDRPTRWLMAWYFMRLWITISPTEVRTRVPLTAPPGDRGGAAGRTISLPGAGILAGFPTAVLGARDASGAPLLMRTRTMARPDGFLVEPAADCDVVPGPATLLVHRHDDRYADLYNALVRGELRQSDGGTWLLVPHRVIEPFGDGGRRDLVRAMRTARRTTKAYLRGRGLPRPRVDWQALKTLAAVSASQAAAET